MAEHANGGRPADRFSETIGAITVSGRRGNPTAGARTEDFPLIIALPGGTYTSAYFDLPGFSLIDRAVALGLPIIALDRPGYGDTTAFPPAEATIANNAERLDLAIGEIWTRDGGRARGIVLIGHSIGGAITVSIAARNPSWPLLGIAVSGVGLVTPKESGSQWAALPKIPMIDLPGAMKDQVMFGPDWTFAPPMPALGHDADAPVPRQELIDITSTWHAAVREIAAKVRVPVHYRQAEFDRLWVVSYGASIDDTYRQVGEYAGRIIKGVKPSELPVLLPTVYQLVINLKAAKALGLTVPTTLLATADEVIE